VRGPQAAKAMSRALKPADTQANRYACCTVSRPAAAAMSPFVSSRRNSRTVSGRASSSITGPGPAATLLPKSPRARHRRIHAPAGCHVAARVEPHPLHGLVLDGVDCTTGEGVPVFHPAPALTAEKLQALLGKIITRILRQLTRQGHRVEEEGMTYVTDAHGIIDPDNVHAPLQAASGYCVALGPRAGRESAELAIRNQPRRADDATPVRQRPRIGACMRGRGSRCRATPGARAPVSLHYAPGHCQ
jgi:hypothetical protein